MKNSGDKKIKTQISKEEKEYKNLRKKVQKKLMQFATRIPISMYLTDYREESIKDVILKFDSKLFSKVTSLKISDFELLLDLGVFNRSEMNDAVIKLKRYEDNYLAYTGIVKHNSIEIGPFDTKIQNEFIIQSKK